MEMLINGKKTKARDGKELKVFNPATKELLDTVPMATLEDVEQAIEVAHKGQKIWSGTPLFKRAEILNEFVMLMRQHHKALAQLESLEMGKIIRECESEISVGAKIFAGFVERANHLYGEVMPENQEGCEKDIIFTRREPLGVISCIIPFNYPVELFCHKVAPALIMGNSVIVKPASDNPLIAIRLVELLLEAGVPGSAIQVVTGSGATVGASLIKSGHVDAVSLTGSTEVGIDVARNSAKHLHHVFLELGGNDAMIVMEDADLDFAVEQTLAGRVSNTGQTCCATKRVLVHESVKETYLEKLVARLDRVRRGNPIDPETEVGCLINERAATEVANQVQATLAQGAECIYGGTQNGAYYEPTVLANVTKKMDVAVDLEIFGPVIPVISFATDAEAVEIANAPIYGLQCGIITEDIKRAMNIASQIEVGTVVLNGTGNYRQLDMAFGGTKMTGLGREGVSYTLEEMSKIKNYVLKSILD